MTSARAKTSAEIVAEYEAVRESCANVTADTIHRHIIELHGGSFVGFVTAQDLLGTHEPLPPLSVP